MSPPPQPMQAITVRPRFGIALTVTVWLICVISLVAVGVEEGALPLLRYCPEGLLAGYLCWMVFWAPAVGIDPSGVSLHNIVRTQRVTWPAIQRIDTRYALTLVTARRKFTAWSAPAPSRFSVMMARSQELRSLPETTYGPGNTVGLGDLPRSDSGIAAYHVRRYWEALRDAGHLDAGAVEGTGVATTWHRRQLITVGVLVVVTVIANCL